MASQCVLMEEDVKENWESEALPAVLLVEDDPVVANCLETALIKTGLTVRKTSTVREGVRSFNRETFAIAILDICLPDNSGFELARTIRLSDPQFPIIIMTGFPDGRNISQSMDVAADAYLMKPFSVKKLLTLVEKLIIQPAPVM